PTFSYVFESQLEDLQFGDRFYYLFRNQGEDLFALLEGNTFSSLIQRNTNASLLSAEIFLSHDPVLDLENLPSPLPAQLRVLPGGGYQWDGDEHIETHGNRTLADHIVGGEGDDALWGYGGNDRIEGRAGVDAIVAARATTSSPTPSATTTSRAATATTPSTPARVSTWCSVATGSTSWS